MSDPISTDPDWDRLCALFDAGRAEDSHARLKPIFDVISQLARPTTVPIGNGGWVLGIDADRTADARATLIAAVVEVVNGYLETFRELAYADTVALKTMGAHMAHYLQGDSWKKWDR